MYFGPETGGYKQTVGHVRRFLDHWCSIGAICWRMCQHWALGLFFCFRKISSWLCVWNYTPGSKQGRLSEKKTAVRQWITVLWPDKCLSEEWMRKLGVCQESHTHTQSLVCSCTHVCMQMPASSHMERQKQNIEPNRFYYPDETLARVVSQHNINPVKVKDKHPMFTTTVQPWEEEEEMLFFFWGRLWKVCAAHFGSGMALQCKQRTSSDWPLWTEQAASHKYVWACRAQCCLSLTWLLGTQAS